jgi:hypothetical protein
MPDSGRRGRKIINDREPGGRLFPGIPRSNRRKGQLFSGPRKSERNDRHPGQLGRPAAGAGVCPPGGTGWSGASSAGLRRCTRSFVGRQRPGRSGGDRGRRRARRSTRPWLWPVPTVRPETDLAGGFRLFACNVGCKIPKSPHSCAIPLSTGCHHFAILGGGGPRNRGDLSLQVPAGLGVKIFLGVPFFFLITESRGGDRAVRRGRRSHRHRPVSGRRSPSLVDFVFDHRAWPVRLPDPVSRPPYLSWSHQRFGPGRAAPLPQA